MGKWWNRLFSCGKVKYWKDLKIIKCKNGELINFNVKKKNGYWKIKEIN